MNDRNRPDPGRPGPLARFLARSRAKARPPRFSTVLRMLGEEAGDRIALARLVEVFGDRAFGALMFVFAVPNVLPLPPGSSAVLGLPLILIAAQLAIGRRTLWLPSVLADRSIDGLVFRRMVSATAPWLRRIERVLAPRLDVLFGAVGDRLTGAICLFLAIVLFLPIPLGNIPPGLSISLFALALMQRDGLAAIAGWIAAAISIGILVLVSGALWIAAKAFLEALF